MSIYLSPLRYPGGKGRLATFVKSLLEDNHLLDGTYVEPYAGGAGIAFSLLFGEYARRVYINDISPHLHAFWKCVLEDTENLCRKIHDTSVTLEEWRQQRLLYQNFQEASLLELGFSTFFLNRTNRSGIMTGGIIGGWTQVSQYKIDARYNKEDLIKRIKKIAAYGARIRLYNMDAQVFISDVMPTIQGEGLIYLDPPYYIKGQELYENHYVPADHAAIARLVTTHMPHKWIVSYDDTPDVRALYQGHEIRAYTLSYSAAQRVEGSEIMIFCPTLQVPDQIVVSRSQLRRARHGGGKQPEADQLPIWQEAELIAEPICQPE